DAVGGERFGGCRCVDRQFHGGGVGISPSSGGGYGGELQPCRSRTLSRSREAHFHAVIGRNGDALACAFAQGQIAALNHDVYGHRFVRLVLEHHGQLEAVAEVEEARRGGAHHQRQAGGQGGLAAAEMAVAGHSHGHDAVAGQVVWELHSHFSAALLVGVGGGGKGGQRVEVGTYADGRRFLGGVGCCAIQVGSGSCRRHFHFGGFFCHRTIGRCLCARRH